jgi:NTE family protein
MSFMTLRRLHIALLSLLTAGAFPFSLSAEEFSLVKESSLSEKSSLSEESSLVKEPSFAKTHTPYGGQASPSESKTKTKTTARPKVAVVLAGGGAKGLAHIGALKVLEESGIPIDIVVGNSMGSIVGGLYAIGYSTAEMDSVVRNTDWLPLLLDAPDYGNEMLAARKLSEIYQLRVALDPDRHQVDAHKGGIIQGRNIGALLTRLTSTMPDSVSFDSLPIPFACNATEAIGGTIYEFHDGNLAQAMRASMAIPGIFTPVRKDSLLFVDGFVTNNYPVDVAKRMGADIVIGIDLVSNVPPEERYANVLDLVTHMIDVSSTHLYEDNIRKSDVYIDVDVTEYSSASFRQVDVDSLITRGERRARQLLPQIEQLANRLQKQYGKETPRYVTAQRWRQDQLKQERQRQIDDSIRLAQAADQQAIDSLALSEQKEGFFRHFRSNYLASSANLGMRFDNDEYVSAHMGVNMALPVRFPLEVSVYGRLGQRMIGAVGIRHSVGKNGNIDLSYLFGHGSFGYYNHGQRVADITRDRQCTQLFFGQTWHNVLYTFGLTYNWNRYTDILINHNVDNLDPVHENQRERFFTWLGQAEYNSQNSIYFPTEGTRVSGKLQLVTDNLYEYKDRMMIPIVSLSWSTAVTIGSGLTFIPHGCGRLIVDDHNLTPLVLRNVIGGLQEGMKTAQQLPMAGIATMEILSENAFAAVGLELQQHLGDRHYIKAAIDGGSLGSRLDDVFSHTGFTWGTQMGYSYSSMAGPISLTAYWSERTKEMRLMLNVGYCF